MKLPIISLLIASSFALASLIACQHKPFNVYPVSSDTAGYGNYPADVAKIISTKCVNGCHDAANYKNSYNLRLDTWAHLFEGCTNGAVVIPYRSDYSSLMYYINTNPLRGAVGIPTMPFNENPPYNRPPLSNDEYNTLKKWIDAGAPDKNGNIAFSSLADTRQKIYITMVNCNELGVIDGETHLMMRLVSLGYSNMVSPHAVRVSPDGKYVYVCFFGNGQYLTKINTSTDQIEGYIDLHRNSTGKFGSAWTGLNIRNDNTDIVVSDFFAGLFTHVNASSMQQGYQISDKDWNNLHSIVRYHGKSVDEDTFYLTCQAGNYIIKSWSGDNKLVTVDNKSPSNDSSTGYNPHDLIMLPGEDRYMVTCQRTKTEKGQVIVMDAHSDKPIKEFQVGRFPQEVVISPKNHRAYITCQEDPDPNTNYAGSVYVIDYENLSATPIVISGQEFGHPHGIAVDERNNLLYVVSAGGAHAHTAQPICGGSNGFCDTYDLTTLKKVGIHNEVLPGAYTADVRFKN